MSWLLQAGAVAGALLAIAAVVGLVIKYALLPHLERQLAPLRRQVEETHHSVTVNSHQSSVPTLRDLVDDVKKEQKVALDEFREEVSRQVRREASTLHESVRVIGHLYDQHIDHAAARDAALWEAIHRLDGRTVDDQEGGDDAD